MKVSIKTTLFAILMSTALVTNAEVATATVGVSYQADVHHHAVAHHHAAKGDKCEGKCPQAAKGAKCEGKCPQAVKGAKCEGKCPQAAKGAKCEGKCPQGAKCAKCEGKCPQAAKGAKCEGKCPQAAKDAKCEGKCPQGAKCEGKCPQAAKGAKCEGKCPQAAKGAKCEGKCPQAVKGAKCKGKCPQIAKGKKCAKKGMMGMHVFKYLDLTADQKVEIKTLIKQQQDMKQAQRALINAEIDALMIAPTFDEAKAKVLIDMREESRKQEMLGKIKLHNQIYNMLTPEQQAKFKFYMAHKQAHGHKRGHH